MPIDWRSKVEGLFAKANAQGATKEESEALLEKAMYLMQKYGIEEAELRIREGKIEKPTMETFFIGSPYSTRKADLLGIVAHFLGCQAIVKSERSIKRMFIVGFHEDIERVKVLYHSLLAQMNIDMLSVRIPQGEDTRAYRNAFIVGFISAVQHRMDAITNKIKAEPGTDLVLFDRQKRVDDVMNDLFNIAGPKKTEISISSRAGLTAGASAGQRADIGQPKISR